MKVILIAAVAVLLVSTAAQADRRMSLVAGRCPVGTYAQGGGTFANNVKNCSASNKPFAARFEQKK